VGYVSYFKKERSEHCCFHAMMQDKNQWEGELVAKDVTREEMLSDFTGFDIRLQNLLEVSSQYLTPI
jgi:hypothetical protein